MIELDANKGRSIYNLRYFLNYIKNHYIKLPIFYGLLMRELLSRRGGDIVLRH